MTFVIVRPARLQTVSCFIHLLGLLYIQLSFYLKHGKKSRYVIRVSPYLLLTVFTDHFISFSHRNRGSLPVRHYQASPPERDLSTDQRLSYIRPLRAGELQVLRSQYEKEGMYAGVQTKFNYAWVRRSIETASHLTTYSRDTSKLTTHLRAFAEGCLNNRA